MEIYISCSILLCHMQRQRKLHLRVNLIRSKNMSVNVIIIQTLLPLNQIWFENITKLFWIYIIIILTRLAG